MSEIQMLRIGAGGSLAIFVLTVPFLSSNAFADETASTKSFSASTGVPDAALQATDLASVLDVTWIVGCAALVLMMQAGFLFIETGIARAKNSINVAIKNLCDLAIAVCGFWLIGYGLMFGLSMGGIVGLSMFAKDFSQQPTDAAVFVFQAMFCGTAATIISGAVAERMSFAGYIALATVTSLVVYPVFGHWAWAGALIGEKVGWLEQLGFVDFAGSTVVHSVGGWVALAAIIAIGPRSGVFDKDGNARLIPPHSLVLTFFGASILFVGWLGFNCGSTLKATVTAGGIALNTVLAGGFGCAAATTTTWLRDGHPRAEDIVNGLLGGLVGITASAPFVSSGSAVVIGIVGGLLIYPTTRLLLRCRLDDAVGAVAVHGFCGAWGTVAVAFFMKSDLVPAGLSRWQFLAVQSAGVAVAFAWSFGIGIVALKLLKRFMRLRVSKRAEKLGLNIVEHKATNGFADLGEAMYRAAKSRKFDTSLKVEPEYGTEVGDLGRSFNRLVEAICFEQENVRRQQTRAEALAYVLDSSHNEIVISSAATRKLISMNRGARENLGYTLPEIHDLRLDDIVFVEQDGSIDELLASADEDTSHFARAQISQKRSDGSRYPVTINVQRTEFMLEDVYVILSIDLTEREVLERQLRQSQKMESLGQMAAGIAHEINTPLQCISGNVEFLKAAQQKLFNLVSACKNQLDRESINSNRLDVLEAQVPDAIDESFNAIQKVIEIIRAMKSMSHPGSKEKTNVDLNALIQDVVTITRNRWHPCADMQVELDPAITNVKAHSAELTQVAINLINNATEAIRERFADTDSKGTIAIRTQQEKEGVSIAVSDNGCGIPAEEQGRIFDPFYTTKEVGQGTGQGLAITHEAIVRGHDGEITVESEVGAGTTFRISIPQVSVNRSGVMFEDTTSSIQATTCS